MRMRATLASGKFLMKAILALEDGSVFHGTGFGARASACGEVCFNTSMTGYQEILTDPSYKGQIVTMTYPLIGNYGVNSQDVESWKPHASGFVIRELSPVVSNWRADFSLAQYLEDNGIPGIQGIDTRALTKKLRVRGALNGFISTEEISEAEAIQRAKEFVFVGVDYVKEVTHKKEFRWDEKDEQSAAFDLVRGIESGRRAQLPQAAAARRHSDCRVRLRHEIQHSPPFAAARFRHAGFARDRQRRRRAEAQARRNFSLERPRRSGGAGLHRARSENAGGHGHSDFRDLPRPPNSRPGVRRENFQTEIRPSRRQPAGERFGIRQSGNHVAKSRLCGGRKNVCRRMSR